MTTKPTDEELLGAAVQTAIDRCPTMADISPAWIATETMIAIGFPHRLHPLGYVGCHLQLRQIARGKLRRQFDPTAKAQADFDQGAMVFADTLQDRYPRAGMKGEEAVYAPRDTLTSGDVAFNVERMERAGQALLKHARALRAWDIERRRMAS